MNYLPIKKDCLEANLKLASIGLVDLTFGNASVYDPELGVFAIKPSGVDYAQLSIDDIVVLDLEGNQLEGDLRPSSDTPTHRRLFIAFGDAGIRSVVHTHSRTAVAFAQAGGEIPCWGTTHCDYFNGSVPVTREMTPEEVGGEYEWETGNVIIEMFNQGALDPVEMSAVLVRNHGPFCWGPSGAKAVENAQALEIIAEMAWKTQLIYPQAPDAPDHLRAKHFSRKHGQHAYYGQK